MKADRLRWQCRRGMLELDYLLLGFLEQTYAGLSEAEQSNFIEFLKEADPDLYAWIVSKEAEPPQRYAELIKKLIV